MAFPDAAAEPIPHATKVSKPALSTSLFKSPYVIPSRTFLESLPIRLYFVAKSKFAPAFIPLFEKVLTLLAI